MTLYLQYYEESSAFVLIINIALASLPGILRGAVRNAIPKMATREADMIRNIVSVVLIVLAGAALDARADKWIDPMPRLFASQSGQFGFKSLEPKLLGASKGVLFALQNDGAEKVIWRATFPNTPHQVFIANDGRFVVTVDTWGVLGSDHSLVIYDGRGTQVRSLKLEDLLPTNEIKANVKQTVSSRWWAENATFQFVEDDRLLIRLSWGKQLRIRLATGRLE